MRYRRANISGATYFFTVNLEDRSSTLLTDQIDLLRNVMRTVLRSHPVDIIAMVVLPDHLHALWRLPEGDTDFPMRWSLIKAGFSRAIPRAEEITTSREHKRERGIWQRRYWEHLIRDDEDMERHAAYTYGNLVKHGYVTKAEDWPYSSIHRDIAKGLVLCDWGVN